MTKYNRSNGTTIITQRTTADREANKGRFNLKQLLGDIKANGHIYIKSPSIVRELLKADDHVTKEYIKEDDIFILTYQYDTD